jgi:hypothetical protein
MKGLWVCVGGLVIVTLLTGCGGVDVLPAAGMVGAWEGDCNPVVSWCQQERLDIYLEIAEDGGLTGTVGDATIPSGQLRQNDPLALAFGNPYYFSPVDLEGPLVEAEEITRDSGSFLFDFEGGQLVGDFDTSGAHVGDKDTMWMKCIDMTLTRVVE